MSAGLESRVALVTGGASGIGGAVVAGLLGRPRGAHRGGAGGADERARASTPLGRAGSAEEVAALVAFLLSEEAAYMTGGVYPVDGGAGAVNPFRPSWTEVTRR